MKTDFTAEKQIKDEAERMKKEAKTKSLATIVTESEVKKFVTQDFNRFDKHYVELYRQDKLNLFMKDLKKIEAQKEPKFDVKTFTQQERLSKRLSRLGVCSRRQAERLIEQGMVRVDGKVIDSNVAVNDENYIQISGNAIHTPTQENTRIWVYNKPQKLI
jgi:ribosomal protein S4